MTNELLFFIHIFLIFGFALGALRLGRGALTVWIVLQAVLANLFVLKQIDIFGFVVTCSDVFIIGSIFGLNLLQEYHGKNEAKKATWICFYFMLFFTVMSQIHLLYTPSALDTTHNAFSILFKPAPRLLIASLAVFFVVQRLDIALFAFLRNRFLMAPLALRNGISLTLSQALDTVLFTYAGLYGLISSPVDVMLLSMIVKCVIIACLAPSIALCKRLLPKSPENPGNGVSA